MRAIATAVALACALGACVKSDSKPGEPETRADDATASSPTVAPPAAIDAGAAAVSKVECPMMLALIAAVRDTRVAMDARGAFDRALADWQAVADECRDGRWHMVAAQLLRTGFADEVTAGDHRFESASQALAAGLARDPDSPELLEMIAYLSAIAPDESPALPADACDRIAAGDSNEARDRRHYVCGHAALRGGDVRTAAAELGAVVNRRLFPDLELRTAIALLRTDDRAGARAAAEKMADTTVQSALAFGATETEAAALKKQAAELIASL